MYKPMVENHLCKCLADLSCNNVTMYLIRIQVSAKFVIWINWIKVKVLASRRFILLSVLFYSRSRALHFFQQCRCYELYHLDLDNLKLRKAFLFGILISY